MQARAGILLANQPDIQRRFDRLNGVAGTGNPVAALMGYLPGMAAGGTLSMSGSLSQLERLAGNQVQSRFDVWASLTHGRYNFEGADGKFTLGALGADYLVSRNLLVGAFVQIDRLAQDDDNGPASVEGTGWMAGPYVTARLSEHLFLDMLAAGGTSSNKVSPYGTYEDGFDATRYMASAALQGEWKHDAWTFSPRARLSWYRERSDSYTDSLGVPIPSVTAELGQIAIGPGVAHRFALESGAVIDAGLRFDLVADFVRNSVQGDDEAMHGRVEGNLGVLLPNGARVSLSATHDGIGRTNVRSTSASIKASIPFR